MTSFWDFACYARGGTVLYFRALLAWLRPPLGGAVHCAAAKNSFYKGIMGIEETLERSLTSVRRLVWAGKPQLGNAAWGASFPSERALPAGGFGSVHTPSP